MVEISSCIYWLREFLVKTKFSEFVNKMHSDHKHKIYLFTINSCLLVIEQLQGNSTLRAGFYITAGTNFSVGSCDYNRDVYRMKSHIITRCYTKITDIWCFCLNVYAVVIPQRLD